MEPLRLRSFRFVCRGRCSSKSTESSGASGKRLRLDVQANTDSADLKDARPIGPSQLVAPLFARAALAPGYAAWPPVHAFAGFNASRQMSMKASVWSWAISACSTDFKPAWKLKHVRRLRSLTKCAVALWYSERSNSKKRTADELKWSVAWRRPMHNLSCPTSWQILCSSLPGKVRNCRLSESLFSSELAGTIAPPQLVSQGAQIPELEKAKQRGSKARGHFQRWSGDQDASRTCVLMSRRPWRLRHGQSKPICPGLSFRNFGCWQDFHHCGQRRNIAQRSAAQPCRKSGLEDRLHCWAVHETYAALSGLRNMGGQGLEVWPIPLIVLFTGSDAFQIPQPLTMREAFRDVSGSNSGFLWLLISLRAADPSISSKHDTHYDSWNKPWRLEPLHTVTQESSKEWFYAQFFRLRTAQSAHICGFLRWKEMRKLSTVCCCGCSSGFKDSCGALLPVWGSEPTALCKTQSQWTGSAELCSASEGVPSRSKITFSWSVPFLGHEGNDRNLQYHSQGSALLSTEAVSATPGALQAHASRRTKPDRKILWESSIAI